VVLRVREMRGYELIPRAPPLLNPLLQFLATSFAELAGRQLLRSSPGRLRGFEEGNGLILGERAGP
jgi:hypothetical protein